MAGLCSPQGSRDAGWTLFSKPGELGVNSGVPGAKMLAPEKEGSADEDEEVA